MESNDTLLDIYILYIYVCLCIYIYIILYIYIYIMRDRANVRANDSMREAEA